MAQTYLGNQKRSCGCSQLGSSSYTQLAPTDASFDVIIDEEKENWQIDGGSDKDPVINNPDKDSDLSPQPPAMDEKAPIPAPYDKPDENLTIQPTSGSGDSSSNPDSVAQKTTKIIKAGVTNPWALGLLLLAAGGYAWNHFQNQ